MTGVFRISQQTSETPSDVLLNTLLTLMTYLPLSEKWIEWNDSRLRWCSIIRNTVWTKRSGIKGQSLITTRLCLELILLRSRRWVTEIQCPNKRLYKIDHFLYNFFIVSPLPQKTQFCCHGDSPDKTFHAAKRLLKAARSCSCNGLTLGADHKCQSKRLCFHYSALYQSKAVLKLQTIKKECTLITDIITSSTKMRVWEEELDQQVQKGPNF